METKLLNEEVTGQVQQIFNDLKEPVEMMFFSQKANCEYCDETLQLIDEIASLSDKIGLSIYDIDADQAIAQQYKVDKAPGIVLAGRDGDQILDFGVRYAGIPSGHEFSSLIHDLVLVSGRDSGLSEETRQFLSSLDQPVLLQVFVTPTCPYCPRAVVQAFRMAMESPNITASMVEATEFPHLANKYQVSGVPHTVIGESPQPMVGAYPEAAALDLILNAVA